MTYTKKLEEKLVVYNQFVKENPTIAESLETFSFALFKELSLNNLTDSPALIPILITSFYIQGMLDHEALCHSRDTLTKNRDAEAGTAGA